MNEKSTRVAAVIIDVSKSRLHANRAALQRELLDVFYQVNEIVTAVQDIEPTVGDEFQAVYATTHQAIRATLMIRLLLPDNVDCRFGIGLGEVRTVGSGVVGVVQDGSAWWSAREAIVEARQHEYSKLGFVRTWFRTAAPANLRKVQPVGCSDDESVVNAYLLSRDHIVGAMGARARRLFRGHLTGLTQATLAENEGITQSAVSQNLAKSGANALIASEMLMGAHS